MSASHAYHRTFGKTSLLVPPLVFRGEVLDDSVPLPEQTKRVICGEWLKHVTPPVAISFQADNIQSGSIRLVGDTLRRLDVPPEDVIINFEFDVLSTAPATNQAHEFFLHFDDAQHLLGAPYAPSLVTLQVTSDGGDDDANSETRFDVRPIREVLNRWAAQNGGAHKEMPGCWIPASAGMTIPIALGLTVGTANELGDNRSIAGLDYVRLKRGPTILDRSSAQLEQVKRIAEQGVGVITSGVFAGGFPVGGSRYNGRPIGTNDPGDRSRLTWRKAFTSLCHGHGVRPAHACMQYVLSIPGVTAVSVSTSHPDRVGESVHDATTPVPPALWASMEEEGLLEASSHVLN
jgi:D-threo-aldose 1-dehydrogenase